MTQQEHLILENIIYNRGHNLARETIRAYKHDRRDNSLADAREALEFIAGISETVNAITIGIFADFAEEAQEEKKDAKRNKH